MGFSGSKRHEGPILVAVTLYAVQLGDVNADKPGSLRHLGAYWCFRLWVSSGGPYNWRQDFPSNLDCDRLWFIMRVLALETSARVGSVATLEDDRILGQMVFDSDQRTAQSFTPGIVQQLESVGWSPSDVELVVVTIGPGSFTGLRIGITAAKTLAYAVGAEVIGLNTLKVIASQVPADRQDVWAVMDAQRGQLFAVRFRRRDDDWETIVETHIVDNERWLQSLSADTAVAGPGLARLRDRLPAEIDVVGDDCWTPQAATVGRVGYLEFQSGRRDDLWALAPEYYRKSAAEEKFDAKAANRQ